MIQGLRDDFESKHVDEEATQRRLTTAIAQVERIDKMVLHLGQEVLATGQRSGLVVLGRTAARGQESNGFLDRAGTVDLEGFHGGSADFR